MAGIKRTRDGTRKAVEKPARNPQPPPSASNQSAAQPPSTTTAPSQAPSKPASKPKPQGTNHQKRPRLPPSATITKRPLLHPAIPTPFASSYAPKVLYINASTPYISAVKRVRRLLSEIERREKQSVSARHNFGRGGRGRGNGRGRGRPMVEANGRLAPADVEAEIADGAASARARGTSDQAVSREKVCLKATGRAIARALEIGVHFQGSGEFGVRVEMGNVSAIDDVEVPEPEGEGQEDSEDEVPETRIRTLSSVTVSIWTQ